MVGFEIPMLYSILAILISTATRVTSHSTPQEVHSSLINNLDTVHAHLDTLSRSIRSVHSDLSARQLDECRVMGPMSDDICSALENEKNREEKDLLDQLIHNPLAPGKRSGKEAIDTEKRKLLLDDLSRKQRLLEDILTAIAQAQTSIQSESPVVASSKGKEAATLTLDFTVRLSIIPLLLICTTGFRALSAPVSAGGAIQRKGNTNLSKISEVNTEHVINSEI